MACLLVVLCHSGYQGFVPLVKGAGTFGVMLFFVLSGFLMGYHYQPRALSPRYWLAFLVHRVIRVYPAFFFATFGYLLLRQYLPPDFPLYGKGPPWDELFRGWMLVEMRGIFWTIPVEIAFYAVYPLIAAAAVVLKPASFLRLLALLWTSLILSKAWGGSWILSCFSFFVSGVLAAALYRRVETGKTPAYLWEALAGAGLIGLTVALAKLSVVDLSGGRLWSHAWYLSPLMATVILSIGLSWKVLGRVFAHPVSRLVGKISYSVYLMHFFVITAVRVGFPQALRTWWVVFAATFAVSSVYFAVVERPFTRLAKKASARLRPA